MGNYVFRPEHQVGSYRKSDSFYLASVLLLWGLGVYTLFICTPIIGERYFHQRSYFVVRHLTNSIIGASGFIFFSVCPMKLIRRIIVPMTAAALLLSIAAIFGDEKNGASRWVSIPFISSFQPSEFAKFAIVLYLAHLFESHSEEYEENKNEVLFPILALSLFVLVIFAQKDYSTGVFIFISGIVMFLISGVRLRWLIYISPLLIFLFALMVLIEPYRLNRVLAFLNPDEYRHTFGFQYSASERIINSAGIWGLGSGTKLETVASIPEVQTDYIFSGWTCSMGLLGVTLYFILLVFFAYRGVRIAFNCPCKFASFASFGCIFSIFFQSLVNVAVVCGVLPSTGIPLPFFSSGGSSLIFTLCMCGFVINASHCISDNEEETKYSEKSEENIESFEGVIVEYE